MTWSTEILLDRSYRYWVGSHAEHLIIDPEIVWKLQCSQRGLDWLTQKCHSSSREEVTFSLTLALMPESNEPQQ